MEPSPPRERGQLPREDSAGPAGWEGAAGRQAPGQREGRDTSRWWMEVPLLPRLDAGTQRGGWPGGHGPGMCEVH